MKPLWAGSGAPVSRYGKTALIRMRQHHQYEHAEREDRIAIRLEEIVRKAAQEFRRR